MQIYVKYEFGSDVKTLGYKLKLQYIFIQSGVSFAFFFGGMIYDYYGISGAALFGMGCSFMELLCLIAFVAIERA